MHLYDADVLSLLIICDYWYMLCHTLTRRAGENAHHHTEVVAAAKVELELLGEI